MFTTNQNTKVNLLFFVNENINPKDYFNQQNKINNQNNNNKKVNKPLESKPESEPSDDNKNSPQNSPSEEPFFSFLDNEKEKEKQNSENLNNEEIIFPLPGFDIFDCSKMPPFSFQDDVGKISTGPSEPKQSKIELIKKEEIVNSKRMRTYCFHVKNNTSKNRKSSSPSKRNRERSRRKI